MNLEWRRIPLLASPQGGVAEQIKKHREAPANCEAGVVFRWITKGKPPRLRPCRWLRKIFLMTQPPFLAAMQGGEYASISIHSQILSRGFQCSQPTSPVRATERVFVQSPSNH